MFFKISEKQPVVLSKQPIVLYLGVLREVENIEQDALMSPNPKGKLEDLVAGCVCVLSSCLKLVNSLLKMIQVHLNL